MLHVVSGDGAARAAKTLGLEGEQLVWREALATGPVSRQPHGADFYQARAAYLGGDVAELAEQRQRLLEAAERGDDIVLWFGRDLFCQVILAAIARGVVDAGLGAARFSLVLPDGDVDRCLGGTPQDFARWFESATTVSPAELAAMATLWDAYVAADPKALAAAAAGTALGAAHGAMQRALLQHARRFPDADGLGSDERAILEALSGGDELSFGDIFRAFGRARAELGWGDVQVSEVIDGLASLPDPAITRRESMVSSTERGRQALAGARDLRADGNDLPRTLGGVSLGPSQPDWRWDGSRVVDAGRDQFST